MKVIHYSAALLALLLAACSSPQASQAQADRDAIIGQMHATWDRPESPLDTGPVVVEGDYAVADWTQGAMGGRALLKREQGTWTTVLCAGDGIRTADGLAAVGLPAGQAGVLAAKLAKAEQQISAERLAQMSAFMGILRMRPKAGRHDAHQ